MMSTWRVGLAGLHVIVLKCRSGQAAQDAALTGEVAW